MLLESRMGEKKKAKWLYLSKVGRSPESKASCSSRTKLVCPGWRNKPTSCRPRSRMKVTHCSTTRGTKRTPYRRSYSTVSSRRWPKTPARQKDFHKFPFWSKDSSVSHCLDYDLRCSAFNIFHVTHLNTSSCFIWNDIHTLYIIWTHKAQHCFQTQLFFLSYVQMFIISFGHGTILYGWLRLVCKV